MLCCCIIEQRQDNVCHHEERRDSCKPLKKRGRAGRRSQFHGNRTAVCAGGQTETCSTPPSQHARTRIRWRQKQGKESSSPVSPLSGLCVSRVAVFPAQNKPTYIMNRRQTVYTDIDVSDSPASAETGRRLVLSLLSSSHVISLLMTRRSSYSFISTVCYSNSGRALE